jgi:hypothetical protein
MNPLNKESSKMTSKHTPGPWRVDDWAIVTGDVDLPDKIAVVVRAPKSKPIDEANARLIAAAPEMLEEIARLKLQYQSSQEALTECQEELVEVTDMLRDLVSNPRRGLFPADALKRARALLAKVDDNG